MKTGITPELIRASMQHIAPDPEAALDSFLPDPACYTEAEFIRRMLRRRLHFQTVERLMVGYYRVERLVSVRTTPGKGDAYQVRVPLMMILNHARRIGADSLVFGHNHPNGCAAPSAGDVFSSQITFEACWRCGITLRDELIVSQKGIYSMRDFGPWPKALKSYSAVLKKNLIFPN